jgi:hypothetical protein
MSELVITVCALCYSSTWGLGNTHTEAQEFMSGPCLGAKARFLSFDRTQSRAVTGLPLDIMPGEYVFT